LPEGLDQLTGYLARLGLDQGVLVLFDSRTQAPPIPERCLRTEQQYQGRQITIQRL